MKVRLRDTELFFDVDGAKVVPDGPWVRERPTVLMLPTGPGPDHSLYKEHIGPFLAQFAQVVYVDPRGTGRSDWSVPGLWTLDTWVEDVRAFLELVEIDRPVVLGTGNGGSVGLLVASRYPDLVGRLVLVSSVARYVHTRAIAEFDRLGGPSAGDVAARYFADPTPTSFGEFMRVCGPLYARHSVPPDVFARMEMNVELTAAWDRAGDNEFDLREDAARIRCPVLLLAGEDDPSMTMAGAEELAAALPQRLVRFHRFAETGHGVFRDRPEAFELVREFVLSAA